MQIIDKSTLKTAIADYYHRDDLTTMLDTFIFSAEARINRALRCKEMQKRSYALINNSFNDLPDDYIHMISVQLGERVPFAFKTDNQQDIDRMEGENSFSINGNVIQIRPTVTDGIEIEIMYYAKVAALVNDTDTNDILKVHPMIYLYGALIDVAFNTNDDDRAPMWESAFTREIELSNDDAMHAKYSGAPLVVRGN